MNAKIILGIIFALLPLRAVWGQQLVKVAPSYCLEIKPPLALESNKIYRPGCDSLLIISRGYLNGLIGNYKKEIRVLEDRESVTLTQLKEKDLAYKRMAKRFYEYDSIAQKTLIKVDKNILGTIEKLDRVRDKLDQHILQAEGIHATVKDARKKDFWDKVWFTAGGVALGVLTATALN